MWAIHLEFEAFDAAPPMPAQVVMNFVNSEVASPYLKDAASVLKSHAAAASEVDALEVLAPIQNSKHTIRCLLSTNAQVSLAKRPT